MIYLVFRVDTHYEPVIPDLVYVCLSEMEADRLCRFKAAQTIYSCTTFHVVATEPSTLNNPVEVDACE